MPDFSDDLERYLVRHLLRIQPYRPPRSLFLALRVSPPGGGRAQELRGKGYQRAPVGSFRWCPRLHVATNAVHVIFPAAAADWPLVTEFALYDLPRGGRLLLWADLEDPVQVVAGQRCCFAAGSLSIALAAQGYPITARGTIASAAGH